MGESGGSGALEICSYRSVFELERRIYRVDRLRLNPQGVPVRGVVYALVLLAVAAVAERLPGVGLVARLLPWYARDLGVPVALAALITTLRIDGRPFHLAAVALARLAAGPRYLSSLRAGQRPGRVWLPPDLVMLPDGSDPRPRRFRFAGPGAVVAALAGERALSRRGAIATLLRSPDVALRAAPAAGRRARVIEVARGARLETRPEMAQVGGETRPGGAGLPGEAVRRAEAARRGEAVTCGRR